jgi:hypothetical protein
VASAGRAIGTHQRHHTHGTINGCTGVEELGLELLPQLRNSLGGQWLSVFDRCQGGVTRNLKRALMTS